MANGQVVSETVLGSSNPVARFGRSLGSSFRGIAFGLILIVVGFGLLWYSESKKDYSKDVLALPLLTATQTAPNFSGNVKVDGPLTVVKAVTAPKTGQAVLYYNYVKEEWKKKKVVSTETQTIQRDGQDVEQQIEKVDYVDAWLPVTEKTEWADFKIGNLSVVGAGADLRATLLSAYNQEKILPSVAAATGVTPDLLPATKEREIVTILPTTVPRLLVTGSAVSGMVASGAPFIITDLDNAGLIAQMQSAENKMYWGLKIAAWLCMTIGFVMLLGPLAVFLNIIPGLGGLLNTLLFVVFGVLSAIIVLLGTLAIRYWWAMLGGIIVLLVLLAVFKRKK